MGLPQHAFTVFFIIYVSFGAQGQTETNLEYSCPASEPYTECSDSDICQFPYEKCPLLSTHTDVRCVVNHCGGCQPVFVDSRGIIIDCLTREVLECPINLPRQTACLPCLEATCKAYPSAVCVSQPCGECTAEFYNRQGHHVNCSTGQNSTCPEGFNRIAYDRLQPSPCERASSPALPLARCVGKLCTNSLSNNSSSLVEFYNANAKLVNCNETAYSDICFSGLQPLCQNQARCILTSDEEGDGFMCACQKGFEGPLCEHNVKGNSARRNGDLAVKIVMAGVCLGTVLTGLIIGYYKYSKRRHRTAQPREASDDHGDGVKQACLTDGLPNGGDELAEKGGQPIEGDQV